MEGLMNKRTVQRIRNIVMVFVFALSFAALAPSVRAKTPSGPSVELVGTVEAVNGSTLTVDGFTVDVSQLGLKSVPAVGKTLTIHGTLLVNGSIQASDLKVADRGLVLRGTVDKIGKDALVVDGVEISTLNATGGSQLQVGSVITVHLGLVNGKLVASEVGNDEGQNSSGDEDCKNNDNNGQNDNKNDNNDGQANDNNGQNDKDKDCQNKNDDGQNDNQDQGNNGNNNDSGQGGN
jgi:Domain of unknown function (DUF5666)